MACRVSHFETEASLVLGAIIAQQQNPQSVPQQLWPDVITQALRNKLAPMLLWAVTQGGVKTRANPLWEPVWSAVHISGLRYTLFETARQEIDRALVEANVEAIWLKGIALAPSIYPQPALRPMGDLDVLVPFEQRHQALHAVEPLGYRIDAAGEILFASGEEPSPSWGYHYFLNNHLAYPEVALELHFRLLNVAMSPEHTQWFWSQAGSLGTGQGLKTLTAEAHLLYLCAHAIIHHGEVDTHLSNYLDLHLLITRLPIRWPIVIDQAAALSWSSAVDRALTLTMQFFGTPVPDSVFVDLRASRPAHRKNMREVRLQGAGARWEKKRRKLAGISRSRQLWTLMRLAVPPQVFMRRRYQVAPDHAVWPYYLRRWRDQARDFGLWVWSRVENRVKTKP